MNRSVEESSLKKTDAVEALLQRAAPRPVPPEADERLVRDAVRAEWTEVTRRRSARRRYMTAGIAAAVVLAATAGFNALRLSGIAPVEVATIAKSHGSIYVRGGEGDATAGVRNSIVTGQTISTAGDAAAGLEWSGGGSLRIDENTRIEFISGTEVYLHSGRVYFDSATGASNAVLNVATPHGNVTNLGTQFMIGSDARSLTVSVRDGQVRIDGRYHDETAHDGQRLVFTGSARPVYTNIRGTEPEWRWLEEVSPGVEIDRRPIHVFLEWVGSETGYEVEYADGEAERLARTEELRGVLRGSPRSELERRMATAGMEATFDHDRAVLVIGLSR